MKDIISRSVTVSITPDIESTLLTNNSIIPSTTTTTTTTTTTKLNSTDSTDTNTNIILPNKTLINCNYIPVVHHSVPVVDLINDHMNKVISEQVTDDAFAVADVGSIIRQHRQWIDKLPMVRPFYAVKCNPDPIILQTMVRLGTGFDCASKTEIMSVLKLGVNPNNIIYANPCKAPSQIKYASSVGVRMMTFDNVDELHKIKQYHNNNPQLVLRILTDDSKSLCKFGIKFGAHLDRTEHLLSVAKQIGIDIIGVSFHVGSGCMDAVSFTDAIIRARHVFNQGLSLGFNMHLLDIGGGFPGADAKHGITFDDIVYQLRPAIELHFPKHLGITIISEPGRYYVSAAYTLAMAVHARRVIHNNTSSSSLSDNNINNYNQQQQQLNNRIPKSFMYYVNEGLYSAFNCIYYDHYVPQLNVLLKDGAFLYGVNLNDTFPVYSCSVWGPTCDSMDLITKDGILPELHIGDWLYVNAMGAYTVAASSTFNGFQKCQIIWTNTENNYLVV